MDPDSEAYGLWQFLNGYDIADPDTRAERIMQSFLDGAHIGPSNREIVRTMLADHFREFRELVLREAKIEAGKG